MTEQEQLAKKIQEASPAALVVMMLEGVQDRLEEGRMATASGDTEGLETTVEEIRSILGELLATLWGDSEVAIQSRQLYIYVNKLVTDAKNRQAGEPLEEAKKVLQPLLDAWQHLAKHPEMAQAPAATKGPSVVAGMTYGKSALNESILNGGDRLGKG